MPNYTLNTRKAFPTAIGFGQNAEGGRNGAILHVNTLASTDTGTYDAQTGIGYGTLRWAKNQTFPRTIIFDVSGIIDLGGSTFSIFDDNCSILGQTAPGDGITLVNGNFRTRGASEVIIRFLRLRDAPTNLNIASSVNNIDGTISSDIVWDHCSITGGRDENWSVGASGNNTEIRRITLQNSIVGEGKDDTFFYGTLLGTDAYEISMIRNFYINNLNRIPEHTYGDGSSFEWVNNLIYNYNRPVTMAFGLSTMESIGNVWKADADFPPSQAIHVHQLNSIENPGGTVEQGVVWDEDNIQIGFANPFGMRNSNWQQHITVNNRTQRTLNSPYTPVSSQLVEDLVLNDVGPSVLFTDSYDARLFTEYNNSTGIIGRQNLTTPAVAEVSRDVNYDSNVNGIPNSFSTTHNISSPHQVITSWDFGDYTVTNNAGYTALEMYSFWLADDFQKLTADLGEPTNQVNGNKGTLYLLNT